MMQCGHAANATFALPDGSSAPCCAICAGIGEGAFRIAPEPKLVGRMAKCDCGALRPSEDRVRLAFFEYLGPGARNVECKVCGRYEYAHGELPRCDGATPITDHAFVPKVHEHDRFYCGCRGWD